MKHIFSFIIVLFLGAYTSAKNLLNYDEVIDLKNFKGQTFLSVMKSTIKPALDLKATEGFYVSDSEIVRTQVELVDEKVARKALSATHGIDGLLELADQLADEHKITFYDLPQKISDLGHKKGIYDLTTFFSLVSQGGVAVKIDSNNMTYNVNYGTGELENDERTGRSFGEGPDRQALDASDKHYLTILENYVVSEPENLSYFYKSLLEILFNSDVKNYKKISPSGQVVATDFLAVYIAEQNRHLMTGLQKHPWDEALLEVTLLAAFHSGQDEIALLKENKMTQTTFKQVNGCFTGEKQSKKASLIDYWQFSSNPDPSHCSRSGINITRKEFRTLGAIITDAVRENDPELLSRIETKLGLSRPSKNIYASLSSFLINLDTPDNLDAETISVIKDLVEFLDLSRELANEITRGNS